MIQGMRCWKQGRSRLPAERRLTGGGNRVEDIAMLLLERGHHRHHRCNKARALHTLRPKAPLAPQDPWPNRPLGGVVRGFHPFVTHERPQGLPQLKQLPAGAFGLGHPTALARVQPPLHCLPHRPHRAGKGPMGQRAVADPMPPLEHLPGLRPQGFPTSRDCPPRSILASISRRRCAQQTCRRHVG